MFRLGLAALLAAGCGAPPAAEQTYTLSTGAFTVPPGSERTQCFYTPLPVDGDLAVDRFTAHMRPGSHHFNFYYLPPGSPPPAAGLGDCSVELRIFLAGSQWQDLDQSLPAGKALRIPRGSWLALESHFVNATPSDAQGGVDVTLHAADPAAVTDFVGVYFNVMNQIHVAPQASAVLGARCPAIGGTSVFLLTSHMHHFGSQFDIDLYTEGQAGSTPLYSSTDWEHPVIDEVAPAPIDLVDGQGFAWRCHYNNDRATDLYGGDSAIDNEMCIMAAFYWPEAPGLPYCFADAVAQ
jgi:hypothetical protein